MFLCSLLVLVTSGLFPERPGGEINVWDLLPGLTFTGDDLWNASLGKLLDVHIGSIEGAFWSLYIEVKFYVVLASALFYSFLY
jgi:hypothetical protein